MSAEAIIKQQARSILKSNFPKALIALAIVLLPYAVIDGTTTAISFTVMELVSDDSLAEILVYSIGYPVEIVMAFLYSPVINGYIRDMDGVTALDFPVYARGFLPPAPTRVKDGEINTPISLGGVTICPGDLVMGDCDGICVIPRAHVEAVLDAAEKRKAYEEARQAVIDAYVRAKDAGETLPDLTPAWVKEALNQAD